MKEAHYEVLVSTKHNSAKDNPHVGVFFKPKKKKKEKKVYTFYLEVLEAHTYSSTKRHVVPF